MTELMRQTILCLSAASFFAGLCLGQAASWWERLGLGQPKTTNAPAASGLAGLSQQQMVAGLKEALTKGVHQAVATLGKPDGFLKDLSVRIPMPEQLKRVEQSLRALGQGALADEFVTTLNRAAEKAVPEATAVLSDAIKQLTVADARAILTGSNNAATAYFRRTSETNLYSRFLPIVQQATAQTGVTRAYKNMTAKAGFLGSLLGPEASDLDAYVTRKALDGLFLKVAEEEKRIRENPVARTTDLLQKVFGSIQK